MAPLGWDKSLDPALLSIDASVQHQPYDYYQYDHNLTHTHGTAAYQQPTFHADWQQSHYMTPISQLTRSSHARQESVWGPTH